MRHCKELTPGEIADMKQAVIEVAEKSVSFVRSNWKALHDFLDKQAELDASNAETTSEEADVEGTAVAGFMRAEKRP